MGQHGPTCKLCAADKRDVIDAAVAAGATFLEVKALALATGIDALVERTVINHRQHVQAAEEEVHDEMYFLVENTKKRLVAEMSQQPPLGQAQYAIIIATLGDVLDRRRVKDPRLAIQAIKAVQDRTGVGDGDEMKAFMRGVVAAAKAIAAEPRELPEPETTEVFVGEVETTSA